MSEDARWPPEAEPVRCRRCNDAGWLKVNHARPWELRPRDQLIPCPCRGAVSAKEGDRR